MEEKTSRRKFLKWAAAGGLGLAAGGAWAKSHFDHLAAMPHYPANCGCNVGKLKNFSAAKPNIIIINCDDLGYGDLGCYGSTAIKTPRLDELAGQGVRFTDFSTCDAVCTPSRAGLLTGRYPVRMGLDIPTFPAKMPILSRIALKFGYLTGKLGIADSDTADAAQGIDKCEITIPEALKQAGYRTGMVGKWHLGDFNIDPGYNPVRHGFDAYFGVPYSNDMNPYPLYRNEEKIESDIKDTSKLTGLYTQEAEKFISSSAAGAPFFLYIAHTFPHRPMNASKNFLGKSKGGLYGDAVEEIDWSVGRLLETLEKHNLAQNTIIFFTSDNGPWYDGSSGGLRGHKGQTFEGGHRVPFLCSWPGHIPPGSTCDQPASNIDLFPTCLAAAGLDIPADRAIDGKNITQLLTTPGASSPHDYLYYYHNAQLEGIRSGKWKYIRGVSHYVWPLPNNKILGQFDKHTRGPLPLLFNLATDPMEAYNLAGNYPSTVKKLDNAMTAWEKEMTRNPQGFKN